MPQTRERQYDRSRRGVDPAMLRVSHADRDVVVDRLKVAYCEGRLDKDEFDERLDAALTAKTRGDLDRLLRDVADLAPRPVERPVVGVTRPLPSGEERVLGMLSHWLGVVTWLFGPAIIMGTAGRRSAFVRAQAIEALNFTITWTLVLIVAPLIAFFTFGIGFVLFVVAPIMMVVAGFTALGGTTMRYPLCLRLIKRSASRS